MKFGVSSYCLDSLMEKGQMTLFEVIDWVARQGGESIEFVPFAFKLSDEASRMIDTRLISQVKRRAIDAGIEAVNYSVLANLCVEDDEAYEKEVERICHHVDVAAELGVPRMRHDISAFRRPLDQNGLSDFDKLLPRMIEGAQRITEYARTRGVRTLIENHGFFVNGCDRVERVMNGVNHENYGLLLDTGNIACVDEDPTVAAWRLAKRAEIVHLKDFYIRSRDPGDTTQFDCGGHWFRSYAGKYLRGSILAQGDLDIWAILKELKKAGFDGNLMIEFEGLEEPAYATAVSLSNARRIWEEV